MNTTEQNKAATARKSNAMDYIITAIGCALILYCCIDWHFTSKRLRADLRESHERIMRSYDETTQAIQGNTEKMKALNAETQAFTTEEK